MAADTDTVDLEGLVNEFELKLDRLRVLYEQYFLGIARREPQVQLKDVVRVMRALDRDKAKMRNTAVRFRMRNLVQKFNTYRSYWSRTMRSIEAGTYVRDVARMRRKLTKRGVAMPKLGQLKSAGAIERALAEAVTGESTDAPQERRSAASVRGRPAADLVDPSPASTEGPRDFDDNEPTAEHPIVATRAASAAPPPTPSPASAQPSERPGHNDPQAPSGQASQGPASPRPPRSPSPGPSPGPRSSGMSEPELQSLYRRFVKAKRMCGEDPAAVRYETLIKTIDKQLPQLQKIHQGREIEFQVVIRDGRTILKAKPR